MATIRRQIIPMIVDTLGVQRKQFLPTVVNTLPDLTTDQPFLDALQDLSVGVIRAAIVQEVKYYVGMPTSGVYGTARDAARFVFSSFAGEQVQVYVNAPRADMFLTNSDQVDLTMPQVIEFVEQCKAIISDANGGLIRDLVSAERTIIP